MKNLIAVLLALAALVTCGVATAAAPSAVDVTLEPKAARQAPLGAPFAFRAHVVPAEPFSGRVVFTVHAPDGSSVPFFGKDVVLLPGIGDDVEASVTPAQWFRGTGRYEVTASVAGVRAGKPLRFEVTEPATTAPRFAEVTKRAGLGKAVLPATTCGRWASGAAWGDADGDGNLDLYLPRIAAPAQLYLSDGKGTFREEAAVRGVARAGVALGASFADYDNDGDQDLIVVGDGPPRLFRNDGTGRFDQVAAVSGLGGDFMGMSASWGDFDNDGYLDLYVANHTRCASRRITRTAKLTYNPDLLYHNEGDGTFTDVTTWLEHDPAIDADGSTRGAGFVGAWFDYNGDGRQDIYLANDYMGTKPDRNRLWRNDGPKPDGSWQFTDVSVDSGTSFSMNSMGLGVGDFDRDLDLDLAISNWGSSRLLRNNGDATFTDVAADANVERFAQRQGNRSVTWGAEFRDLNNDGWEDLYIAAGFLRGYLSNDVTPQPNEVFVNDRNGGFYDLSAPSGADDRGQTRGAPTADYDRDGRVDVFAVNQQGQSRLLRNVTPRSGKTHWLEVQVAGTRSNRDGCGTRIVLTAAGGKQLREIFCGSTSTNSGSDRVAHFGLGAATKVASLEVTWPTGVKQTVTDGLGVDRLLKLVEPKPTKEQLGRAGLTGKPARLGGHDRGGIVWGWAALLAAAAAALGGIAFAAWRRRRGAGVEAAPKRKRTVTIRGTKYPILLPTLRDPRLHLAAVITSLQVLGQVAFEFQLSIAQILISLGVCAVLEVGIAFWRQKVVMWPASALLTGNGVAFILRVPGTRHGDWWSTHGWWIFAATAAVSLLSKHLIQLRVGPRRDPGEPRARTHIFNPSNIGLVLCFLILGASYAEPLDFWWAPMGPYMGTALALIVCGGLAILVRLKLFMIAVTFWLSFAAGIGVLAASGHAMTARWHLGPITGAYFWWVLASSPEILVFLFFMITDPKTIPSGRSARIAYAVSIGLLASLLIAPQKTEFATKVAVLGSLAIVCAARALWALLASTRWSSLLRREGFVLRSRKGVATALGGAVAVAGLLMLAGIPSRPDSNAAAAPIRDPSALPDVVVGKSKGVASTIDRATALRIARDVVDALRKEAEPKRDTTVPEYHVERMRVMLERAEGQGPPTVVASVRGKVRLLTYTDSIHRVERRSDLKPFAKTLELSLDGGRYVIARVRSG